MAGRLKLTAAFGTQDINRPLVEGRVKPPGIELIPLVMPSPQRHWRMARHLEFDVCEFSLASYLAMLGTGDCPFVAIPVFPHRRFRHGYVFVKAGSQHDIRDAVPAARIGLRTWQTTAGLWLRGILQDEYGLDLRRVSWRTQDEEDLPLPHLSGFSIQRVPSGQTVTSMLERGELDALIYPEAPPSLGNGIVRLFADVKEAEIAYFERTGIFPIMHTVVIKQTVLDDYPWVARTLLEAFREAAALTFRAMHDPRSLSLAWAEQLMDEQERILGRDPWAFSLERNRGVLHTAIRYGEEQGLIPSAFPVDDLFYPSTRGELPEYVRA